MNKFTEKVLHLYTKILEAQAQNEKKENKLIQQVMQQNATFLASVKVKQKKIDELIEQSQRLIEKVANDRILEASKGNQKMIS